MKKLSMKKIRAAVRTILLVLLIIPSNTFAQEYNLDKTLSDQAQKTTIAFDGLAFFTGSLGADSFFPPGKVADFWGFQYLRDNDPTEMGHNTDFLTRAAHNMLSILTESQIDQLNDLAVRQIDLINDYGYDRFVLMKAFRRLLEGNTPAGKDQLDPEAVKEYSADLYALDGQISFERAKVMGDILYNLNTEQKQYLDDLQGKGMLDWPDISEPACLQGLERDHKVAVMTYAGDLFSWYLGSLDADVYFCPERQGTYFGSFYLKDAPAVNNPGYNIGTNITADYGNYFLETLTTAQADYVNSLVDSQKPYLLDIVDKREEVSLLLRKFMNNENADSNEVIGLMRTYGELDGEIVYNYAKCFAEIFKEQTADQIAAMQAYREELIGDLNPTGAYLYSNEIPIPEIISTDFLFTAVTGVDDITGTPAEYKLMQNYPNPFNPTTTIEFQLAESGAVSLHVYNILGKKVAQLINENKPAGHHSYTFNTGHLPSGTYFYQLVTNNKILTKKMLLVK